MKLGEIASYLNCQLLGDPHVEITGLSTIEEASHGQLTFLSNQRYRHHLEMTQATAIILDDAAMLPPRMSGLISATPYLAFAQALALFFTPAPSPQGIHPLAVISSSATIGEGVSIGPFSVIGDEAQIKDQVTILSHCAIYPRVEIGEHSFIHSHCVIREGCRLGKDVILQNGVVIGSDGFGYAQRPDRSWHKIPQTGIVLIEDEVEIGAGTTIDRATLGTTRIKRGAKLDNLVQVGHGSTIGEYSLLCAQVGLAGSTHVGREAILGGQVGAAGHLTIGDRVVATAQSGIPNSVEADRTISGYPAIDNRAWLKAAAIFAHLPQLQKELRRLKMKLEEIESQLPQSANSTLNGAS